MAVSAKLDEIMNAAEVRIRSAGYNGFSFRDLAADVGIKSASVHHHFPTKSALAAAVARRYTDRFYAALPEGNGMVAAWQSAFSRALQQDGQLCLCGMLGAEVGTLPPEVAIEARRFFEQGIERLSALYKGPAEHGQTVALQTLAILEGAMLIARTMGDPALFDQATKGIA